MSPEDTLISLIKLLDTYKLSQMGLIITSDDCNILSEKLKEIIKKYNITSPIMEIKEND